MSDYFGPGQSRVLNVADRSLDQVAFQQSRPPLTSEWNLINQICDLKSQEGIKVNYPSGWIKVGSIEDTGATSTSDTAKEIEAESTAKSGQIFTSLTYGFNKFKFICKDNTNIAIVNGWPVVVQKSAVDPTNIMMTLPPVTSTSRYDIVFLEIWKKLVSFGDSLYPYGNVNSLPFLDNEILWNVLGAETTKRVQIQYRIRTYSNSLYNVSVDPFLYPEGLGWSNIKPIGGNAEESYVTSYSFKSAGSKDIGLYIAGDGSNTSKELLNTVDGYVYAIPMFIVYRRGSGSLYTVNNPHNNLYGWTDANVGTGSDRPDGKYYDIIYTDDIIDTRHQLVTSGKELDGVLQESFRKLITNELYTSLNKGFTNSHGKLVCSGGSVQLKTDQLNGHDSSIPNIGDGNSSSDIFKKRAYCSADIITDHNIFQLQNLATLWTYGTFSLPTNQNAYGVIISIDGVYFVDTSANDAGSLTGYTHTDTDIALGPSTIVPIVGRATSSCKVYIECTFQYNSQSVGFFDIPKKFYEVSKDIYQPIATKDQNVVVRFDKDHNFIGGSVDDYVKYCGGNYTENYEFGHEYVAFISISNNSFHIDCPDRKYNNYVIHGIKSIQIENSKSTNPNPSDPEGYGFPEGINAVTRVLSGFDIVISPIISTPTSIRITFYTGSGDTEVDSFKFFELSKQGRGVIDTYEMLLKQAFEDPSHTGKYTVDTSSVCKPIIAVATYESYNSPYITGTPFAYDEDGNLISISIVPPGGGSPSPYVNNFLPVLTNTGINASYESWLLPTRIVLNATAGLSSIYVPVLVHSYVTNTESPYTFYYKFNPYRGLLISTDVRKGKIEKEGSAIITSEGSGTINNFAFNYPSFPTSISILQGWRTATQTGEVPWTNYIKPGDYLNIEGYPYLYRILSVDTGTQITLAEQFVESSVTLEHYRIYRLDVPGNNLANIIDIMPSYDATDFNGLNSDIVLGSITGTIQELQTKVAMQDPLNTLINDFQLGLNISAAVRGRSYFRLTDGKNNIFKLGLLTPYVRYGKDSSWDISKGYKKVYQSYLYNESLDDKDLTGRLYLLIISSETYNDQDEIVLSCFSDKDTVDIFELVGRPIIKTI